MQRYVDQLIRDLTDAQRRSSHVEPSRKNDSPEDTFQVIDQFLNLSVTIPFSEHCGIRSEQFPPYDRLTRTQANDILKGIKALIFSWDISLDLPANLPHERIYSLYRQLFDEKIGIIEGMHTSYDYCEQDSTHCPYGSKYCGCLAFELEHAEKKKLVAEQISQMRQELTRLSSFSQETGKYYLMDHQNSEAKFKLSPIHTWLDIQTEFPWWGDLSEDQMLLIINHFKQIWVDNDGLLNWLDHVDTVPGYQQLVCFLNAEAGYDGACGFYIPSLIKGRSITMDPFDYLLKDENVYWKNLDF